MDQADDFNSDAFFNDGPLQQIDAASGLDALTAVPLPSNHAVVQRTLSLQFCGALQDVAWSRQGHVASAVEDGSEIHLQCLYFSTKTSTWNLTPVQIIRTGLDSIISLVWSPTGGDLAVADSKGRVSILQAHATAMNRLTGTRQGIVDEPDQLGQVIGMTWLGQDRVEKQKNVILHASKVGDRWANTHGKANPLGPLWQRAVVTVDRKAVFSIIFQKIDGRYGKATIPLSQSTEILYTHAAFAPTTEGRLLVAVHSYKSTLSVYFVHIDFSEVRQNVDATVALSVEIAATKLSSSANGTLMSGDIYEPDSWSLTHLAIIPTTEVEKTMLSPPTVLAVYSSTNRVATVTDPGYLDSSVVRRWTVSSVEEKLHSRFDDLPTKSSQSTTTYNYSATRLPDKDEQVITSAILTDQGQNLFVTTQDGRTDFLGTDDLSSLVYRASNTEVLSLASSGFGFPIVMSPLCTSLSPNSCMQVARDGHDKIQLITMESHHGQVGQVLDLASPAVDAAIAAVLLTFSRACWSNGNIDDLLSCIKHTLPADAATPLITSLYRTLFRDVEFIHERSNGSELEKVIQKPVLPKVLSFHWGAALLGAQDNTHFTSSLTGQWAWIANNFRFIATLLYLSYREYLNPASVAPDELIEILCGNVRWAFDVLRYITASILEVGDRQTNPEMFPPPSEADGGVEAAEGSQGLVALLLNCHWSRVFMIATVRAFRMFAKLPEPRSKQQTQIIRTIHQYSTGKGMNIVALEGGLLDPRRSGVIDPEDMGVVTNRQIEMMATGVVLEPYRGTVKKVLKNLFNAPGGMREKGQVDRLKLFTDRVDLNALLLRSEWQMSMGEKGTKSVYDVHKKKLITNDGGTSGAPATVMVKRCVRCGCYNEDVSGSGRDWPRHINALIARCVCDGSWIIEPWDQVEPYS